MDHTVREHIESLQARLNALNVALMTGPKSLAERNRIESEIRAVTMALEYFHAALLAEQNISTPLAGIEVHIQKQKLRQRMRRTRPR